MSANAQLAGISAVLNRLQALGAAPYQPPEKCREALALIQTAKAKLDKTESAFLQMMEDNNG